jgi:hypothetical protein
MPFSATDFKELRAAADSSLGARSAPSIDPRKDGLSGFGRPPADAVKYRKNLHGRACVKGGAPAKNRALSVKKHRAQPPLIRAPA